MMGGQVLDTQTGSHPGAAGPFRYLAEVVDQARFRQVTPAHLAALYRAPVPCTMVVTACFRDDGHILLLCTATGDPTGSTPLVCSWDLPHGYLPGGAEPTAHAGQLLPMLAGIVPAAPPHLFGLIDWGARAIAAGWGWTACLLATVGQVNELPSASWAKGRAFLSLEEALANTPADAWADLRRQTLHYAAQAFAQERDYWLLQSGAALALAAGDDSISG